MGWVALAALIVVAAALLALLRLPRILWPLGGAALMLGAAGYATQEQAGLAGQPVVATERSLEGSDTFRRVRGQLWGQFGGESMYFGISDAALRGGNTEIAARILTGGVDYAPGNAAMWAELGNVIALHDGNIVSPAAQIAFRRAIALAPDHPGPPFLFALAYIRAGEPEKAQPWLKRAAALAPADPRYRAAMADLLRETATGARFTPR